MKLSVRLDAPVYLVRGDDDVLLQDTARELIHGLIGDGDRTLMVDELDAARYELDGQVQIGPVVDAAQTPPFLTDRRVVVARQAGVFTTTDSVAPLIAYLADPLPTTALVIVWERPPRAGARLGRVPTKLVDAVKKAGVLVDAGAGSGKARDQWLDDQLRAARVRLDPQARRAVAERIGEDAGLLVGLLGTLSAVFGPDQMVGAGDIAPYLGEEGGVKPFELTDAIDRGDVTGALDKLARLLGGGSWHPLQVMATLTNHYLRMLALDGAGVGDEKAAAELLGMKGSTFPARKALSQSRKLGSERLIEFTTLLAQADLDLRGARAWPAELVVEVLVARLASRTPRSTSGRSSTGRRGASAGRR
jgi:DNA polymerase III subunit delta